MTPHDIISQTLAEECGATSTNWSTVGAAIEWYRWTLPRGYRFFGINDGKFYARHGIPYGLGDMGQYLCDLSDPKLIDYIKKDLEDERHLEPKGPYHADSFRTGG